MSTLPDYREALARALDGLTPLEDVEHTEFEQADGRVLAGDISADRDVPPFNRAQMDGYALRAGDFAATEEWPVVGTIAAGASPAVHVPAGSCVAIATGAPLPDDVDTVVQHELSDRGDRAGRPVRFTITTIQRGHAVHPRGSDAGAGQTVLRSGTILGAQHLGIAAGVGAASLKVRRRPRVTVLTSGDEIVPIDREADAQQVRNSNGPMIKSLLNRIGAEPIAHQHVLDEYDATRAAVADALVSSDMIVTVGGVSAGDRDHFPSACAANEVTTSLQGAAIQPGRPVMVGRDRAGCVLLGLPGNPVSALVCACLFGWPIVRSLLGLPPALPWREVALGADVRPNPRRRAFRPASLHNDGRAVVPQWSGSGDLVHTAATHGIVELPVQDDAVDAGTVVRFLEWP